MKFEHKGVAAPAFRSDSAMLEPETAGTEPLIGEQLVSSSWLAGS